MRAHFFTWCGVALLAGVVAWGAGRETPAAAPAAGKVCIGTYDARAVAVAYAHSPAWNDIVKAKMAEMDAAKAAGDQAKIRQLQAWGENHQTLNHLAAFAGVPLDSAIAHVKPKLADLARQQSLSAIVHQTDWVSADVEVVDVTDQVVALYGPNERVLKIVRSLKQQKPLDPVDVLGMDD